MNIYRQRLEELSKQGNLRHIPADSQSNAVIDMSSNDYLGLALRDNLRHEFLSDPATEALAFTSSASRLLAAVQNEYYQLESELSEAYGGRPTLLFNSGYHANTGIISALASEGETLIIADKLVHASIIDGIMLSKAPWQRFIHNDYNRLETILKKEHPNYNRIIIVVESVYSMDGDRADINALLELKHKYPNVMLYVDEAHAVGVEGPHGLGLTMALTTPDEIDIMIGTFGKALASVGAFCVTSADIKHYLVNRSRSLIFSTAIPPICCSWSRKMLKQSMTMNHEREHLKALGKQLAGGLSAMGCTAKASHIMPFITHSATKALELSGKLLTGGFKVLPIRTPTVPPGTERLRISLNATLTANDINHFIDTLSSNE